MLKEIARPAYHRAQSVRYRRKGRPRTFAGRTFRWRYDYSRFDNYEPPVYEAFVERLQAGMTVFDVGSWIGLYTVTAAAAGCDVFAFEPSPVTRAVLKQHLRLNDVIATTVPAAMTDQAGEKMLYTQGASGLASLSECAASASSSCPAVEPPTGSWFRR